MGTWSSALYGNDSTCDVRGSYLGFLEEGLSSKEAYEKTLEKNKEYIGDQDEPLFWYALADTQWKVGRLTPEVKAKALEWIAKDGGIELWKESKAGGSGWKKTLETLKVKLESPMPPEKKIRKPAVIDMDFWSLNDIYAYQFHEDEYREYGTCGKYMLIQKIASEDSGWGPSGVKMRVHVFDKLFDKLPTIDDVDGLRILPLEYAHNTWSNLLTNCLMYIERSKDYPAEYLTYIGRKSAPTNNVSKRNAMNSLNWKDIEYWSRYFRDWHNKKYQLTEDGVFRACR